MSTELPEGITLNLTHVVCSSSPLLPNRLILSLTICFWGLSVVFLNVTLSLEQYLRFHLVFIKHYDFNEPTPPGSVESRAAKDTFWLLCNSVGSAMPYWFSGFNANSPIPFPTAYKSQSVSIPGRSHPLAAHSQPLRYRI